MPRYVILEHDLPTLHWDFMLEDGAVLQTWKLATAPAAGPAIAATFLSAHRLMYLDYEGPVSGGRGQVTRWDAGTFIWQVREEAKMEVRLLGQRLRGDVILQQLVAEQWCFRFTALPEDLYC